MALGSGLAASLGLSAESTYGTYVAPARWLEIAKSDLKKVKNTKQGGGLAAGRLVDLASRRVVTTLGGGGGVELEMQNKSMGLLLSHLMGSSAIAQQGATTAWLQTHTLGDNIGKFLTAQAGVPDLAGTVRPYTFLGTKVLGAEFDCEIDGLLTAKFDLDSRDVTEAQTLAAPSYPTGVRPFHGVQLAVKVGATYGSEASVTGVTKVNVKIDRGQKTDLYYAGQAGLKAEPITNDKVKVSGTIEADLVDKTIWADRFAADTQFSLVIEWIGPVISGAYNELFRIKLPACFLDGETPTIDGPDVTKGSFPFTAQFDGTNAAAIIEYQSTDTTI